MICLRKSFRADSCRRGWVARLKAVPFPCVVIWSAEEQVPVRLRKIQKRRTEPALIKPKGMPDPHQASAARALVLR